MFQKWNPKDTQNHGYGRLRKQNVDLILFTTPGPLCVLPGLVVSFQSNTNRLRSYSCQEVITVSISIRPDWSHQLLVTYTLYISASFAPFTVVPNSDQLASTSDYIFIVLHITLGINTCIHTLKNSAARYKANTFEMNGKLCAVFYECTDYRAYTHQNSQHYSAGFWWQNVLKVACV